MYLVMRTDVWILYVYKRDVSIEEAAKECVVRVTARVVIDVDLQ